MKKLIAEFHRKFNYRTFFSRWFFCHSSQRHTIICYSGHTNPCSTKLYTYAHGILRVCVCVCATRISVLYLFIFPFLVYFVVFVVTLVRYLRCCMLLSNSCRFVVSCVCVCVLEALFFGCGFCRCDRHAIQFNRY